jgi:hypothetical protein
MSVWVMLKYINDPMHEAKSILNSVARSCDSASNVAQSSDVGMNPDGSGVAWCLMLFPQPAVSRYFFIIALQYRN